MVRKLSTLGSTIATLGSVLGVLWITCCTNSPSSASPAPEQSAADSGEPIVPVPLQFEFDDKLAALGEALFVSPALSRDGLVSCASCHLSELALTDGKSLSVVPGRPPSATNSTTLFNVRYFSRLGWMGRFSSLGEHLDFLIQQPKLMGTDWTEVAARLAHAPEWKARFAGLFPDGVTQVNARAALVEYERSLVTPNAPFDHWLRGDTQALSTQAAHGYQLFKTYGCVSCHQGVAVGANLFEPLGVMRDYFTEHPSINRADMGRFELTRREADRHVFRVPSLRNVALTAPYFHDGSAPTLEVAVAVMARHQLDRELDAADIGAITEFLRSLTGEYRGRPL